MSSRRWWRAVAFALVAAGCRSELPQVGDPVVPPAPVEPGLVVRLMGAKVDAGVVRASFVVTRDGKLLTAADAAALGLGWTLAALEQEPVDGAPAWRSLLLTGPETQTLTSLPVAGPETPPAQVLAGVRQPWIDQGGAYADTGAGAIAYAFGVPFPADVAPATTLRVGVFLTAGAVSPRTTDTVDFRQDGGAVARRQVVLDTNCQQCHGVLTAHGGTRTGTRICVTCHTWQHADPDTVDPAAQAGASGATNPNPLELGRLVHRIHRGKDLPTLYTASPPNPSTSGTPPPFTVQPPLPFYPSTLRNAPAANRSFSVVAERSLEHVFGRTVTRWDVAQVNSRIVTVGVKWPRDLRHCDGCHGGAADGDVTGKEISRRTCQSCHADVYFGPWSAGATDAYHFPHTGGPQADDTACQDCHGANGKYAPLADVHVPPVLSPHLDAPVAEIVDVQGMQVPVGGQPAAPVVVSFTLTDRYDAITPFSAPSPASDADHPIPRALTSTSSTGVTSSTVGLTLAGPTADYSAIGNKQILVTVPLVDASGNPFAADATTGVYSYELPAGTLPATATGTWAVALSATRSLSTQATYYDVANDRFPYPYTGETIREAANNPIAYVDVETGLVTGATPRRTVVEQARCERCHLRLTHHGSRNNVAFCVMCHATDKTDQARRQKNGVVVLSATYDGLEERSTHFKMLVHRIHTGARRGSAELTATQPFAIGGATPTFFDWVEFPGNLADCTLCHPAGTYGVEAVPAGAAPTVANETGTLLHAPSTAAHPVDASNAPLCPSVPPITASCISCHDTSTAIAHAASNVTSGREGCASCHGAKASSGVAKVHGLAE